MTEHPVSDAVRDGFVIDSTSPDQLVGSRHIPYTITCSAVGVLHKLALHHSPRSEGYENGRDVHLYVTGPGVVGKESS